ncbi:maleylpyruvate isomerase family mycothiol-dependent enzyme [Actinoplanes sp. CA-015351]|uniref:maleylpyruvate isomerase family mycothiol-dependent enzyme n=1 Tax=Actinoplanes sp. CA-015351 TaxID=3239897 RepID=UPI003D96ABF6
MRVDEYVETLRSDGLSLAAAAERAGLTAPIAGCPGWQIRDLLAHLGGVHRWAAAHVRTPSPGPLPDGDFFEAPDDAALLHWFRAGHHDLVDILETADPAMRCWTFLPAPSPLTFWARRQAHETAIHRADAEAATGAVSSWTPAFAVDGINELVEDLFAGSSRLAANPPLSIALAATDAGVAWTLTLDHTGLHVRDGLHPAGLTLGGSASDLYLLLWNRTGLDRLDTTGDRRALDIWKANAKITREP